MEINKIVKRNQNRKSTILILGKINQIDFSYSKKKKKGMKTQITKIKNECGDVTTDFAEVKKKNYE